MLLKYIKQIIIFKRVKDKLDEFDDSNSESESESTEKIPKPIEIDTVSLLSVTSSIYQIEIPSISNEFYYWQGKDYSNCYKEDFKELESYAKG